jgi:ferredoxin-NADP reductase
LTKDNFEEWFVCHTGYVWLSGQYTTFKNQAINTLLSRYYSQTKPSERALLQIGI